MKKYKLISLGLLLAGFVGLTSCDDAPVTALPQENPQGPVLEGFSGATATLSSTLSSGINLDNLINSGTESIQAFTVSAGSSGLNASDIWGEFEISGSSSFSPSFVFDAENGMISVADLAEAQSEIFGKAPGVKTVYYRIPLYAKVNGTDYRVGGLDSYGAVGSFNSQSVDPGFSIDSHYYIIGVEGWDPATNCTELSHSSASPYDDPVFTFSVTTESGFWWKLVSEAVYESTQSPGFNADTDFWPLLIGVEVDGDESLTGELIYSNAQSGHIVPGTWTMSFNLKDNTYWIEGKPLFNEGQPWSPAGIYFRGGMNDWGTPTTDEFLYTDNVDNGNYVNPFATISSGVEFKIADTGWSNPNLGSTGELTFGEPYALEDNGGNIVMTQDFVGYALLLDNSGSWTVTMNTFESAITGETSGIYLRGGMNDWGTSSDYEFVTTSCAGVFELAGVAISAGTEFKIADEGWGPINLGGSDVDFTTNVAYALFDGAGNLSLSQDFSGTIRLVYISEVNKYFVYLLTD